MSKGRRNRKKKKKERKKETNKQTNKQRNKERNKDRAYKEYSIHSNNMGVCWKVHNVNKHWHWQQSARAQRWENNSSSSADEIANVNLLTMTSYTYYKIL